MGRGSAAITSTATRIAPLRYNLRLEASENLSWVIFASKLPDAWVIRVHSSKGV